MESPEVSMRQRTTPTSTAHYAGQVPGWPLRASPRSCSPPIEVGRRPPSTTTARHSSPTSNVRHLGRSSPVEIDPFSPESHRRGSPAKTRSTRWKGLLCLLLLMLAVLVWFVGADMRLGEHMKREDTSSKQREAAEHTQSHICPAGTYVHENHCARCGRGKFTAAPSRSRRCKLCPEGFFASEKGMTQCKPNSEKGVGYTCGRASDGPVLGGIDVVQLVKVWEQSKKRIIPPKGSLKFQTKTRLTGQYVFRFINQQNMEAFQRNPLRFAPQIGGYCAWGLSGFDPHGQGLFYVCLTSPDCYYVDPSMNLYFFVNEDITDYLASSTTHKLLPRGSKTLESARRSFFDRILAQTRQPCFNTNMAGTPARFHNSADGDEHDEYEGRSQKKWEKCGAKLTISKDGLQVKREFGGLRDTDCLAIGSESMTDGVVWWEVQLTKAPGGSWDGDVMVGVFGPGIKLKGEDEHLSDHVYFLNCKSGALWGHGAVSRDRRKDRPQVKEGDRVGVLIRAIGESPEQNSITFYVNGVKVGLGAGGSFRGSIIKGRLRLGAAIYSKDILVKVLPNSVPPVSATGGDSPD